MKLSDIGYYTDDVSERWRDAVAACNNTEDLRALCTAWAELCPDALAAIGPEFDFADFERVRRMEAHNEFSGEEAVVKYGAILVPERLMRASMAAVMYKVPEGVAIRKLAEANWGKDVTT